MREWARVVKRDVLLVYLVARDSRVPWPVKMLAAAVAAYALSPIDLIPDFIPVVGHLDDLVIVPLGILAVVKLVPVERLIATLGDPDAAVRLAAVFAFKGCFPTKPYFLPHAAAIKPALEPCLADADKAVEEQAGHLWRLLEL